VKAQHNSIWLVSYICIERLRNASIAIFFFHAFGRLSKILFSTDIASVSSRSQSLEAWITCPIEELGQQGIAQLSSRHVCFTGKIDHELYIMLARL